MEGKRVAVVGGQYDGMTGTVVELRGLDTILVNVDSYGDRKLDLLQLEVIE